MTSDASNLNYRVAIFTNHEDPHELSTVFQHILNLHPTDAMIWSRHVPGILRELFTEHQAEELASAVRDIGLQSTAIHCNEVVDLHQAKVVHHARCEEPGLQIVGLHGELATLVPWSSIQMLCVGEVPYENTKHFPTGSWSGVSAGHYYQRTEVDILNTPGLQLWIACADPYPQLSIEHDRMNYEYLGSRLVDSSSANFHEFIQDLTKHARQALLPESTVEYLKHARPERFRFKSTEELLQYATRNILLARQHPAANDPNR